MAIDINKIASVNLVSNTRADQSPAPTEKPKLIEPGRAQSVSKSDKIIPLAASNRQMLAGISETKPANQSQQEIKSLSTSLSSVVDELSRSVQSIQRKLEFKIDDNSGRTVVTVRDSKSEEVIRQFPSEQILELSARVREMQADRITNSSIEAQGLLFTSKT